MSSKKTANYQLNQWVKSDQVLMDEFNRDNALLDAALTDLAAKNGQKADSSALTTLNQTVNALIQTVNTKADASRVEAVAASVPKIACGMYTGDGAESRLIPLDFTPKAVLVIHSQGITYYNSGNNYHYGGLAVTGNPAVTSDKLTIVSVEENGFMVYDKDQARGNWWTYVGTNMNNFTYSYIAIG